MKQERKIRRLKMVVVTARVVVMVLRLVQCGVVGVAAYRCRAACGEEGSSSAALVSPQ